MQTMNLLMKQRGREMSRRKTGRRLEKRIAEILKKYGYTVHLTQYSFREFTDKTGKKKIFSQSNDIFNCIDIIAIKPNEKTLWVQVTKDTNVRRKLLKLEDIKWNFPFSRIWLVIGRTQNNRVDRFDIYELLSNYQIKKIGHIYRGKIYFEANER